MQACDKGDQTQVEVARQYRIAPRLLNRLVAEAKKQPEKMRELKQLEKDRSRDYEVVEEVVADLLERSIPIDKAAKVK